MPKSASIKSLRRGGAFFYNLGVGKRSSNFDLDSDVNEKEDGGDEEKQKPAALETEARVVAARPWFHASRDLGSSPSLLARSRRRHGSSSCHLRGGAGLWLHEALSRPSVRTRGHL